MLALARDVGAPVASAEPGPADRLRERDGYAVRRPPGRPPAACAPPVERHADPHPHVHGVGYGLELAWPEAAVVQDTSRTSPGRHQV